MKKEIYFEDISYEIPESIEEAERLARETRLRDPFPELLPSLLNKHDIIKYVSKTGIIFPFTEKQLKSASYEVNVGNEYIRWNRDRNGNTDKDHKCNLKQHDKIPLIRNSITYVDVDATFFVPFYIALRFNLTITHVHRGLLLGTGPLIDPGFCGKIMIPIHNLTNNNYYLKPGSPLIAVEFTKLTPDDVLRKDKIEQYGLDQIDKLYRRNIKKRLSFNEFLLQALPDGINDVESSIGIYINKAEKDSRKEISTSNKIKWSAIISIAVLFIAIFTLTYQMYHLITDVNKYVSDTENQFRDQIDQIKNMTIYNESITNKEQPTFAIDEDHQETNTENQ